LKSLSIPSNIEENDFFPLHLVEIAPQRTPRSNPMPVSSCESDSGTKREQGCTCGKDLFRLSKAAT
jgi:hypothetical protein